MYEMLLHDVADGGRAGGCRGRRLRRGRRRGGWSVSGTMKRRAGRAIRRRSPRLLRGCGHGLLPQSKGFPVGWDAHAAKDEWRRRLEQGMAAVFPFRFRANDAHAVGAERKNRESRRVGEARLTVEAFDERGELWITPNSTCERGDDVEVPEARVVGADVAGVLQRH